MNQEIFWHYRAYIIISSLIIGFLFGFFVRMLIENHKDEKRAGDILAWIISITWWAGSITAFFIGKHISPLFDFTGAAATGHIIGYDFVGKLIKWKS